MSDKEYIFVGRAQLKTRDYIHQIEYENRELKQEIGRLNNIINELEKWLEDYHNATGLSEYETGIDDAVCDTIKKLRELKGSDKE